MKQKIVQIISLTLCLIIFVIAGYCANKAINSFRIEASADTLLTKDNQHYIETKEADFRYNPSDFILVAYKPKDKKIFSKETLEMFLKLHEKIIKIEQVYDVVSIVNAPIFYGADSISGNLKVEDLSWKNKRYSENFMKRVLKDHPLYQGLLVNDRQDALSIKIDFVENSKIRKLNQKIIRLRKILLNNSLSKKDRRKLENYTRKKNQLQNKVENRRQATIEEIRKILAPYSNRGTFYLGGQSLVASQLVKIIKKDLVLFGSTVFTVIAILLTVVFLRFRWTLIPLLTCILCICITLGLFTFFNLKVTVVSANVIALQIILSLAITIHLIEHYRELRRKRDDHHSIVFDTLRAKSKPIIFASLTTSIGFLSLIFSDIQPVISFGWMMVIAMTVNVCVGMIFFSSSLLIFTNLSKERDNPKILKSILGGLVTIVTKHPLLTIIAVALITITGIIGAFKLTSEKSFLNYFSKSTEIYRELSFIDKEFGGSTPFDVLYVIPKEDREKDLLLTAQTVQKVTEITQKLKSFEAIGSVSSISDFTRIAQVVRGKPLTEYELTVFYNSLDKKLRQNIFGSYYAKEFNELRIATRVVDTTSDLNREQLFNSIKQKIRAMGIDEKYISYTNLFVLYQDILSKLINSQIKTLWIVYVAMAILLFILFRSFVIAIIALVPNIITTASIFGILGFLDIPLDIMTMTIAAIAMGISLDDTIHYIHRYLEEKNNSNRAKNTALSVGYALFYTTFIISLGFSSFIFSDFIPSVTFGLLTAFAMIIAFLTDLLILPILLKKAVN